MPLTSMFTPCGLFQLSAETSDAENVYNTLKAQLSSAFDLTQGTYEEAKLYAAAMQIAWARAMVKRVPREMHPLTSYDLLTTLEKDWACTPSAADTLYQRQLRIAARKLLMRGSREEAIVTDLIAAIGSDFIKLNKIPTASEANYPTTATTAGTFPLPALAPKFYKLTSSVPQTGLAWTVGYTAINGSAAPLVGEKLTIEPEIVGNADAVTVTAVGSATFTATFAKAHSIGGWATTASPLWLSNRYQLQVVVSDAVSKNAEKRRKVNDALARHAKSCERWKIVAASSSTQVGPFIFGTAKNTFGATALGAAAVNF